MKKLAFIPLLLMILSCHSNSTNSQQSKNDTAAKNVPAQYPDSAKNKKTANAASSDDKSSADLIGVWETDGEDGYRFQINKDSIFYPEHFVSYKYKVTGDSIRIKYDDGEQSFAFKLKNKDTLIMKSMTEDTVYQHRIK